MNRKHEESAILLYNKLMVAVNERAPLASITTLYSCYVLAVHGWNKSKAAQQLGVARRTLRRWECARALSEIIV